MSTDEIRELIQLVSDTGIAELEVQRGENRVRIRKSFGSESTMLVHAPAPSPAATAPAPAPKAETAAATKPDLQLFYVKSPIVGTFYESASPDSPPFVGIGERVAPGKVLCIIESM